jgi:transcriptional regulator GlxA family with amidase domain
LHRNFLDQTGITPAKFVERARIQAAQRILTKTDETLSAVAAKCGFPSPEALRRAFTRKLGVSPALYRKRMRARGEKAH